MYIFKHTPNEKPPFHSNIYGVTYPNIDVELSSKPDDLDLNDLFEMFLRFCSACGFSTDGYYLAIEEKEEENEQVEPIKKYNHDDIVAPAIPAPFMFPHSHDKKPVLMFTNAPLNTSNTSDVLVERQNEPDSPID